LRHIYLIVEGAGLMQRQRQGSGIERIRD
jgi:hypothetical protein